MKFAEILTIISPGSIIVAFGLSALIGLIFSISPVYRATERDSVGFLRCE